MGSHPPRLPSIDDLDVRGRRVLVRVDLNVPLSTEANGDPAIADDTRILAALPTIEELRARGARLVLVSHLGRPKGHVVAELSMAPVADRLRELTGAKLALAPAVVGEEVKALAERLQDGEMLLLENVRFEAGETENDPAFARALADLVELYVDDAFGVADRHRLGLLVPVGKDHYEVPAPGLGVKQRDRLLAGQPAPRPDGREEVGPLGLPLAGQVAHAGQEPQIKLFFLSDLCHRCSLTGAAPPISSDPCSVRCAPWFPGR